MSDWDEDTEGGNAGSTTTNYSRERTRGGRGGQSRSFVNSSNWRDNSDSRYSNKNDSGYGASRNSRNDYGNDPSTVISVDSNHLGRIIGRGGSKVKELEEDSGARIKVSRDDNTVTVSGGVEAQQRAKELIEEITSSMSNLGGRSSGSNRSYNESGSNTWNSSYDNGAKQYSNDYSANDSSSTLTVDPNCIGKIIGRGGCKIKELQEDSGARINVSRDSGLVTLSGSSEAQQKARELIEEISGGTNQSSYGQYGSKPAYAPYENSSTEKEPPVIDWDEANRQYDNGAKQHSNDYGASDSSSTLTVDPNCIGRIIGRGGSKIKELQEESGARINVSRDSGLVTLSGSSAAQQKARELIEEISGGTNQSSYGQNASKPAYAPYENSISNVQAPLIDWDEVNREHEIARAAHLAKLPPLIKVFYEEAPEISQMSPDEVEQFRLNNNNIQVQYVFGKSENQKPVPNPVETFEQAFRPFPEILVEIRKQGFEKPSPIQCQAWPVLLNGQDLIGISQTGSGKTLAFLLPGLIHIDKQPVPRSQRGGPNILVLAPTRELALQIEKEVNKYSYKGIKCVCVYGGGDRRAQMNACSKGVEIIIATPGRLNDLVAAGAIDVTSVTYLILDEADRMLDMGFEPQIRKTLFDVRPDRQTVMTSATWPEGVRRLAQSYMKDPIQVFIGTLDLAACHSVTQIIEIIAEEDKPERLNEFFDSMSAEDKVIVFVGKKVRADNLSAELSLAGVCAQSIHGDREQCDREQALEDIKSGDVRILIATDVASRGIDIGDITHIINYDFPRNIEEYVHRVGRTGRAGRTGTAITFFTRSDWSNAKDLIPILEEANQVVPDEIHNMASRYESFKERRAREKDQERSDAAGIGGGGDGGRRFGRGGNRGGGGGGWGGGGGGGGWGGGGGGRRGKW